MEQSITLFDLGLYLVLYSFIGWVIETAFYAIVTKRFCNRGVLTQPLLLSCGVSFDLLILVLPTIGERPILKFLATLIIISVVENLSDNLMRRIGPKLRWHPEREGLFSGNAKGIAAAVIAALVYYFSYRIVHPVMMGMLLLIPGIIKRIVVGVLLAALAVDFAVVWYTVRGGDVDRYNQYLQNGAQEKLGHRLTAAIWRRFGKAYPGIRKMSEEEQKSYPFAAGLCLDKLIWVFLVSALMGDVIETLYCGLVNGQWMNRSSVLYGPFSFVWGFGAVVLTITLQKIAQKNDRFVFLAGFFIGGAYEYMCSVFTELVFGTVFWDYSSMPLNIGGRTNVLFCFFWGVLAVIWVKIVYPPMSEAIEKLPALAGKLFTWIVVAVMVCNAVLTSAAMLRYDTRAQRPGASNVVEEFLDREYDDAFMEKRWPNMKVTEGVEKE